MKEKDDKFILMNMDDKRSKKIAEAIGNPTCKKILDYLTYNSEKSEEDIAKALDMKINTVEYNLKKLLESGLIDKTKNFFWSKRGKKIPLYKLAKKHIVISPKSTKPSMTALKAIIPVIIVIAAVWILVALLTPGSEIQQQNSDVFNKFKSVEELQSFLKNNQIKQSMMEGATGVGGMEKGSASFDSEAPTSGASDYSETNIQVAGVDEADVIKNDGKYIYVVSGNKIIIVNAYPAENMEILSEIEFDNSEQVGEIFINGNKLIIFTNEYSPILYEQARCLAIDMCPVPSYGEPVTNVYIYDISNKENPKIDNQVSTSGNYVSSRMIGDYVYVIANQYIQEDIVLPVVAENGKEKIIQATDIAYIPIKDYSFQYTIILAIDINNGDTTEEAILTGSTQNIYVSQNNIYTTFTKYQSWYSDMVKPEKTLITKILIDKNKINYVASGEVKGHILNQFSMDEYENNFRIATTITGYSDNKDTSTNNMYVLDEELNIIGKLEEIAPGESIYSVRFMGKRAYMVTFRHIDPLFVINLEDPTNPEVLGKLKIPGYSDYLHPYDENHIIGIGKEVDASIDADKVHTEGAVYYTAIQGVKLAIFDISDVENPIEMYKEVIGDRGTESLATSNHKAFLFDKARELLVIPMTVAELKEGQSKDMQGEYTFQGAYVYNLNLENGFDLKGKITHYKDQTVFEKSGYYFYGNRNIQRSLYMDDTLYTFSNELIKANDLDNLDEINSVELPYEEDYYGGRGVIY